MMLASGSGIVASAVLSSGGSCFRMALIVSTAVSPLNARAPLTISYSIAPKLKMSLR